MSRNPNAKRRDETDMQWRSRLARVEAEARDRMAPLVTPEAHRHAIYTDEFVMHVETGTKVQTKRRRHKSSLEALHDRGQITQDQHVAAMQIQRVSESIRRGVSVRCASLEARVDCSGSSRNALLEHLAQVRAERAFSKWRVSIRVPRQLIVDMIVDDRGLKETARRHNVGWPRALRMLRDSLDLWNDLRERMNREVDEQDLVTVHARLMRAA